MDFLKGLEEYSGSGAERRGKGEAAAGGEGGEPEEEDGRRPVDRCGHQRTWGTGGVNTGK